MFKELLEYLNQLGESRMRLGLGPTRQILDRLDSPDQKLSSVIISGTNGKGSTCSFLTSIAMEAGKKVGTFTSPHLESVTERIQINGRPVDEGRFGEIGKSLAARLKEFQLEDLTYFEFLTVLAVLIFEKEHVDLAIFEVGLGGRLDATNSLHRIAVGITRIDFDHEKLLGNTLTKIALEKGAIMRPGMPAILAPQDPEALLALEQQAREIGSRWILVDDSLRFSHLGLKGFHQHENAQCAAELAKALSFSSQDIQRGLAQATLPGRLEKWAHSDGREVWLDIAHNPSAAESLAQFFTENHLGPFHLVWGMLKDKRFETFFKCIQPHCQTITLCAPPSSRSWNLQEIQQRLPLEKTTCIEDPLQALTFALTQSEPVLCTGSSYLVGNLRPWLRNQGFSNHSEEGGRTSEKGLPDSLEGFSLRGKGRSA